MRFSRPFSTLALLAALPWLAGAAAPAAAPKPLQVKLSGAQETSLQAQWTAVSGATGYELSWGLGPDASQAGQASLTETKNRIKDLLPGTVYYFKVRALTGKTTGDWSPAASLSTAMPKLDPPVPGEVLDARAELALKHPFPSLDQRWFEVSYGTDRQAANVGVEKTRTASAHLGKLKPDTAYWVKVRVCNASANGPWSDAVSLTTLPYSPGQAPEGLAVKNLAPGRVEATWQRVAAAEKYEVGFALDASLMDRKSSVTNATRAELTLAPNTRYFFKVRSLIEDRPSYWSVEAELLSLPDTPRELKLDNRSQQQIIISWRPGTGSDETQLYEVAWDGGLKGSTLTAMTNLSLEGLPAGRSFSFRVRSRNDSGASPWSQTLNVSTQSLPPAVTGVRIERTEKEQAQVTWSQQGGARAYEVSYGSDPEAENRGFFETPRPPALLRDLLPGVTYQAKVRPILIDQTPGAWSQPVTFATLGVPSDVEGFLLAGQAGREANFTWQSGGVEAYELEIRMPSDMSLGRIIKAAKPPAKVSGLEPNHEYRAAIRACQGDSAGPWSEPVSFTTLPQQAPARVSVSGVTAAEATVTWERLPGPVAATYNVRWAAAGQEWQQRTSLSSLAATLSPLDPNLTYRVEVQAQNAGGAGPWSPETTFRTPNAPPQYPPERLRVDQVTDLSARVSWRPVPGAQGYHLGLGLTSDVSDRPQVVSGETHQTLRNLVPETNYYVKVRAYNATGEGPWTEALWFSTPPSPPITAPTQSAIGNVKTRSLVLSWDADPKALRYEVSIGTDALGEDQGPPQVSHDATFTFVNLQPNTTYRAKVRLVNSGGQGPWSQVRIATTLPE
ncbi:MAG: fibronectin type III domain-containing protein [candidate division FCPU426 bacterium]